ncbi:MAG: GNAT family N-acetyltransferase [Blastocatellia bacterium]
MNEKPQPSIRRAGLTDAGVLAELGTQTFYDTFAVDNTPEDMAAYLSSAFSPALQEAELAANNAIFFIAEIDGTAVGYAKLQSNPSPPCVPGSNPLELCRLYVSQAAIGSGIGAALMRGCISEAQTSGYKTMWLGVWERNVRAQKFYERWGFHLAGEQNFQLGSDAQIDWVMYKEIGGD